ncbi:hypothetical protein Clacol_004172 [Clathrus columnatus]|uniref:BHLH domain-containing protein n=1 Tax=Clathrus columnatus TaxID=1419009 RepID=A0AAV5A913_9AGAM|nr:hypothetical protein Clacol_004172 [Clathrus columnatus]
MDSHRKSPEFPIDPSSPNFSYDFSADGSSAFDFTSSYTVYPSSPRMDFGSLALNSPHPAGPHPGSFFTHFGSTGSSSMNPGGSPNSLTSVSSHRPLTPLEGATISPPLTYPAPVSGSEMEPLDDAPGTGANSPTGGRAAQHHLARGAARYSPMATRPARPAARKSTAATRRSLRREEDDISDEEGDGLGDDVALGMDVGVTSSEVITRRREEIRRQRIESEQRRRDELREGYAKLKHTLPVSNQKSSKVSLLDRAVTYIRQLEANQTTLQTRLNNAEEELKRQRDVNEGLMRTLTEQHRAVTLPALAAAHAAANGDPPSPPERTTLHEDDGTGSHFFRLLPLIF